MPTIFFFVIYSKISHILKIYKNYQVNEKDEDHQHGQEKYIFDNVDENTIMICEK